MLYLLSRCAPRLLRDFLSVLVFFSLSAPSFADAIVLKSTVKRYEAGERLKADETLRLRPRQTVVIVTADGEVVTLNGPDSYTIPSTHRPENDFLQTISALFSASKDEVRLGGVRSDEAFSCELPATVATWLELADLWDRGCHRAALAAFEVARMQQLRPAGPPATLVEQSQKVINP